MPEVATRAPEVQGKIESITKRYAKLRAEHADDIERGQFVPYLVKLWVNDTDHLLAAIDAERPLATPKQLARLKDIRRRNADVRARHVKALKDDAMLHCPVKDLVEEGEFLLGLLAGTLADPDDDDSDDGDTDGV